MNEAIEIPLEWPRDSLSDWDMYRQGKKQVPVKLKAIKKKNAGDKYGQTSQLYIFLKSSIRYELQNRPYKHAV